MNLLEDGPNISVPLNIIWNSCVPPKVAFLGGTLGSMLGQDYHYGPTQKRRFPSDQQNVLYVVRQKKRLAIFWCTALQWSLREDLISLPGAAWVCPFLVKCVYALEVVPT